MQVARDKHQETYQYRYRSQHQVAPKQQTHHRHLDPNLKKAWDFEKNAGIVQEAIDKGLPKTKLMEVPFRMEMSGFARLKKSIPVVGDIGLIWPIMALRLEKELGFELDFISFPQQTKEGQEMRRWIVDQIRPVKKNLLKK